MTRPLTRGAARGTLHVMRFLSMLVLVVSLAACGDDDHTPASQGAVGAMRPEKVAGTYELWICASSECGPGTAMEGTRFGRLVLDVKKSPAATDSAPSFAGCISIGQLQQFDRTPTMRNIAWSPTATPSEIGFTGDTNSEGDYEVTLNDLGGMMRGRARWRRGGVFGEETPDFVVARRLDKVQMACPELVVRVGVDAAAPTKDALGVRGPMGAKGNGKGVVTKSSSVKKS